MQYGSGENIYYFGLDSDQGDQELFFNLFNNARQGYSSTI